MRKVALGLWAGAWLLVAIGCASSDVLGTLFLQSAGNERVVVGSLEDVAKSTQGTLQQLATELTHSHRGDLLLPYLMQWVEQRVRVIAAGLR